MPQVPIQSATHGACAISQLRGGIRAAAFIRVLKLSTLMCVYPPLYAQPIAKDAPTPTALAADMFETIAAIPNVQTLAAMEFAIRQPWINPNKGTLMGQSMSDFATVVVMWTKQASVVAGIKFAGGGGGFANIDDVSKLPLVRQDIKDIGYARFLSLDTPGALAIAPRREWAFVSDDNLVWTN